MGFVAATTTEVTLIAQTLAAPSVGLGRSCASPAFDNDLHLPEGIEDITIEQFTPNARCLDNVDDLEGCSLAL